MERETLIAQWRREEAAPFEGWDFSYLSGRMIEEQPPWSYPALARARMPQATAMLDMGTGGGERLLALREHWPATVVVTEDYPPNVALARERLEPHSVRVEVVPLLEEGPMPFADGEFGLVLNRHSGFNAAEVARILTPGGVFLTQQVHGLWAQDLIAAFGAEPPWSWECLEYQVPRLEGAGLAIDRAEDWQGGLAFTDVGAIVYYLKAVPWLVNGFTVDTHLDTLLALQQRLDRGERLVFEARSYLIEAHKP